METGAIYLRARYFMPGVGQFTQQDSYTGDPKDPLSLNLYIYCKNDPVQYVDRNGNFAISAAFIAGLVSVAIGGFVGGMTAKINGDKIGLGVIGGMAVAALGIYNPYLAGAATFGNEGIQSKFSNYSYTVQQYVPYQPYNQTIKAPVSQQMMYTNQFGYLNTGAEYFSPVSNQFVSPGTYYNDITQMALNTARKHLGLGKGLF